MRRTITISVSDEMHSLITTGMELHYCSTVSEYIRYLVRRDQAPAAVKRDEDEFTMPKTANKVIEEVLRERDAEMESHGIYRL